MTIYYERPKRRTSTPLDEDTSYTVKVRVEKWRLITYGCFWLMCFFAITVNNMWSVEYLKKGVDKNTTAPERLGCGPFNRNNANISYGDGFDFYTQTHLEEKFGYSNICTNWDYPVARESTALVFPFFEYSLVVYLVLDYVATMMSYKRGELPKWFWKITQCITPVVILLCISFRMIFVFIAYEDVKKHTMAFLGLQIALLIVAITNTWQILLTGQSYPTWNLNETTTKKLAWTYLVLNVCISLFKLVATFHFVWHEKPPDWCMKKFLGFEIVVGEVVDKMWMIMSAFLPVIIAKIRMDNEDPLSIQVTMPPHHYRNFKYHDSESDDSNHETKNFIS